MSLHTDVRHDPSEHTGVSRRVDLEPARAHGYAVAQGEELEVPTDLTRMRLAWSGEQGLGPTGGFAGGRWSMVHVGKFGSWALLVVVSFVLVANWKTSHLRDETLRHSSPGALADEAAGQPTRRRR